MVKGRTFVSKKTQKKCIKFIKKFRDMTYEEKMRTRVCEKYTSELYERICMIYDDKNNENRYTFMKIKEDALIHIGNNETFMIKKKYYVKNKNLLRDLYRAKEEIRTNTKYGEWDHSKQCNLTFNAKNVTFFVL